MVSQLRAGGLYLNNPAVALLFLFPLTGVVAVTCDDKKLANGITNHLSKVNNESWNDNTAPTKPPYFPLVGILVCILVLLYLKTTGKI
jgi:hypothetical protein